MTGTSASQSDVRTTAPTTVAAPPVARGRAPSTWARFRRHRPALAGMLVLVVLAVVALTASVIAPGDPFRRAGAPLQPPSLRYLFGTDDLGRDVLVGVIHGTRPSMLVGFLAALTSALLGTLIGGVAGYVGRATDDVLMRFTETVQVVPRFFLVLIVAALFGPSLWTVALLLGLTFWPSTARLLRAQILSLRNRDFVLAARALGVSERRILVRHLLPNALGVVVVSTSLQVGSAMLVEAGLSFLGLGDRTLVSWGAMLNLAQPFIRVAWWAAVFPGLAITLTVMAANLVGDGLTAALDPRRSAVRSGL